VHLLSELRAVLVQPGTEPHQVKLFELSQNGISGPVAYSTLGMRLHNEQSGSSSLFSHPVALAPLPLDAPAAGPVAGTLEERLATALGALQSARPGRLGGQQMEDHLALFVRWAGRPATRRAGEAVFALADGSMPDKLLLRAISRVAARSTAYAPR
jgi:hypothetical protein